MRTLNELNTKDSFSKKVSFSNSYKLLIGALALVFVAGMASSAYALTIDSFDVGETHLTANGTMTMDTQSLGGLDPNEVLLGDRWTKITWQSGDNSQTIMADTSNIFGFDSMAFDSNTGVAGFFQLRYDNGTGSLGGVDLTLGGNADRLFVKFSASDANADVTVTIMDESSNSASKTIATGIGGANGAQTLDFLFSDFGGVDLEDVKKIEVDLQGVASGDYAIDLIGIPQTRIGGTFGSMDTATLLVAGAQANMGLWSLALVGAVAAGAAITYKLKSNKTKQ